VFLTGAGPCDTWLALHTALRAGRIAAGDRVLLRTRGPRREGWVLLEVTGS
jgi:3-oxoacyl-[acyl-carrier-protein] synthase III